MGRQRDPDKLTWNDVLRETKASNYSFGGGLYLRVSKIDPPRPNPPNSRPRKSWIFRYRRLDGTLTDTGLGSIETYDLHQARRRAREKRQELDAYREGKGPAPADRRRAVRQAARLEAARNRTFRQCAEAYITERKWANAKHAAQWPASLKTYAYPQLGDLPVREITTPLVIEVLKPIWNEKPETASRVRQRIEAILGWATVHGYREGGNPARWKNLLDQVFQEKGKVRRVKHHAALPFVEMADLMAALRSQGGTGARALEFAILTAGRTGEVIGARWREVNLAERVWIVPAERMKAGREHRVPLSDAALAVIGPAGRPEGLVFPGARPGSSLSHMALLMTLRRMGRGDLTAHGFRSTFAEWAAERTNYPFEVREMALAHTVGNAVERSYQRSDLFERRRRLMEDWARWCSGLGGGEVVTLARG